MRLWVEDTGIDSPELRARDAEIAQRLGRSTPADEAPTQVLPLLPEPLNGAASKNTLRPQRLDDMIGQDRTRALLKRMIVAAAAHGDPLDHVLLVGPAGYGKTTIANCIANELGVAVYQTEAPVSQDTLLLLGTVMRDGDVLFVDEIHQQAAQERRGRTASMSPEVFLSLLEDFTMPTERGVVTMPRITVIGATTDEGLLPDPFIDRFPIKPHFEPYAPDELAAIATLNARSLNVQLAMDAALRFAAASRGVPRVINNYMKNATRLLPPVGQRRIDNDLAREVVEDLNHTTEDGLTRDMQRTLVFLLTKGVHTTSTGETVYRASVGSIATAIGKSRDAKAVQLRIEPYLIELGFLQVGHGGRRLTDAGAKRARQLNGGTP